MIIIAIINNKFAFFAFCLLFNLKKNDIQNILISKKNKTSMCGQATNNTPPTIKKKNEENSELLTVLHDFCLTFNETGSAFSYVYMRYHFQSLFCPKQHSLINTGKIFLEKKK